MALIGYLIMCFGEPFLGTLLGEPFAGTLLRDLVGHLGTPGKPRESPYDSRMPYGWFMVIFSQVIFLVRRPWFILHG